MYTIEWNWEDMKAIEWYLEDMNANECDWFKLNGIASNW